MPVSPTMPPSPMPSRIASHKQSFLRLIDALLGALLMEVFLKRNLYLIGYHSITDPSTDEEFEAWRYPDQVKLPKDQFILELDWLTEQGHTFISLSEIPMALASGMKKPTVLYFDDGYKDTLQNALPVTLEKNIPIAVFLVIDLLDGTLRHLRGFTESEDPAFTPFLNWEGAKQLLSKGVTIGSHGVQHKKFTNCEPEELEREITDSKKILEERLGIPITVLSYPHGRANETIAARVKSAGYTYAITTREGINTNDSIKKSPYLLTKIDPRGGDSRSDFSAKVRIGGLIATIRNALHI